MTIRNALAGFMVLSTVACGQVSATDSTTTAAAPTNTLIKCHAGNDYLNLSYKRTTLVGHKALLIEGIAQIGSQKLTLKEYAFGIQQDSAMGGRVAYEFITDGVFAEASSLKVKSLTVPYDVHSLFGPEVRISMQNGKVESVVVSGLYPMADEVTNFEISCTGQSFVIRPDLKPFVLE